MIAISTHILDTSLGIPAANVKVSLYECVSGEPTLLGTSLTSRDGRSDGFKLDSFTQAEGKTYKFLFETGNYFESTKRTTLFPVIEVSFKLTDNEIKKLHIPLLINPYGYTTYRGS